MKTHRPLVKVALSTVTPYLLLILFYWESLETEPLAWSALRWFVWGVGYTHFFEYAYHRVAMHRGVKYWGFIKRNHLEHHRVFNGANFTSKRPEDLAHIATPWYVLPVLFFIHSLPASFILSPENMAAFFGGVTLHYLAFEASHWFTHVAGNAFDKVISHIPLANWIRDYQIRHHRLHHEVPEVNFNFNPPFLGDVFGGTFSVPPKNL